MVKIVVVIPVYKAVKELNIFEINSLNNVADRFSGDLNIILVGPENLKENYCTYFSRMEYISFHSDYFRSIMGYNRLLKSLSFYKQFMSFDFLLIAQSDAWIFGTSNQLKYFSKYDYSGAISIYNNEHHGYNGGLSLRNVQASIKALKTWKNYETPLEIWKRHFPVGRVAQPHKLVSVILDLLIRKKVHHRFNFINKGNEDIFWSVLVPKAVPEFKVITPEDAVKFSWENNCEELSKTNELPFGCHGWWNYNYDFWKDIIKINERQGTN